ncbi:MAG TPA: membrane lipoprotein lipid attachment site-containing protein [Alphaproteobacteria bacterium]
MKKPFLILVALVFLASCQNVHKKSNIESGEILVTWKGMTFMHVTGLPKFSDYPSHTKFSGNRAQDIDFSSHKGARSFRTRLREGLTKEPNLAGKYRIVTWGCGTNCQGSMIVDLESGKVYDGFGSSWGYSSRPDSNLIIMQPPHENPEIMMSATFGVTRYYLFQNEKLTVLKEIQYTDYYTTRDLCNSFESDFYCQWDGTDF